MIMHGQNKLKIKALTEIKSFSFLLGLKTNSCLFGAQPQVQPKASLIHNIWLPLVLDGGWRTAAGGSRLVIQLMEVAAATAVAQGSAGSITVHFLEAGAQWQSTEAKFADCRFSRLKMGWIWHRLAERDLTSNARPNKCPR